MPISDQPTYNVALLAAISPQQTSQCVLTSPFVRMADFGSCLAIMKTGAQKPTCANVVLCLEQALDANGSGSKAISGKRDAYLGGGSSGNSRIEINLLASELDSAHGFGWVRMRIDVGTDHAVLDATLLGLDPVSPPASDFNGPGCAVVA